MTGRLDGKVALITGGGSGMGRAAAQAFATEGARVVVADIQQAKAQRVVDAISADPSRALALYVDVANSELVQQMVRTTVSRFGQIDVLYHCAADVQFINHQDRCLVDMPEEVWYRMIDIHLSGVFLCCKYVGQQMRDQRFGSIILSGTVDALIGVAGLDSYTAAKGGVVALTRSFAAGMSAHNVRVNCICPGFVATEGQMEWLANEDSRRLIEQLHLLPIAQPEQIAPFVVYLASDESAVVTGGVFPIDSGYMAFKARLDVMGAIQVNDQKEP